MATIKQGIHKTLSGDEEQIVVSSESVKTEVKMKDLLDLLFARKKHVCPWWCCFTFDNPVRKLFHDPMAILAPYVEPGHTAIDIGPGMGYFTIPLCRLVGNQGKVIAIDIQEKMLDALSRRAERNGVRENLLVHLGRQDGFGIAEQGDFILAFWMVHEVPDQRLFLEGVKQLMKPDASFLMVEPVLHVAKKMFERTIQTGLAVGLKIQARPRIAFSQSVLFRLNQGD